MGDLNVVLTILSSMITPAVLILATSSLLLTTSQRLARSIERARELGNMFEQLQENPKQGNSGRFEYLYYQLQYTSKRARILQNAMTSLYLALSVFIGTSFIIGIVEITNLNGAYVPLAFGMVGATLLFFASMLLLLESRTALKAVDHEMSNILQVNSKHVL